MTGQLPSIAGWDMAIYDPRISRYLLTLANGGWGTATSDSAGPPEESRVLGRLLHFARARSALGLSTGSSLVVVPFQPLRAWATAPKPEPGPEIFPRFRPPIGLPSLAPPLLSDHFLIRRFIGSSPTVEGVQSRGLG